MKPILILLAAPLWAATIYAPGTYEWSVFTDTSRATGLISWDGERYTVAETGGVGEAYRFGLLGFAGATQDGHRLTLAFNGPDGYGTFLRRLSEPPVTLGYLPYGHLYGGYWPDDIPRFLGDCEEPWRMVNYGECNYPATPDGSPDPIIPGNQVPEPGTLALLGAALIGLALMRRGR